MQQRQDWTLLKLYGYDELIIELNQLKPELGAIETSGYE